MEVYGKKPKIFTREWWPYFWEYYKWHTIAILAAAAAVIYSAVSCANEVKYDLKADYISEHLITSEQEEALTALIEENIDDVNQNGSTDAFLLVMNMDFDPEDPGQDAQMAQAMQTKLIIEQGYSESFVFLFSKTYADRFTEVEVMENASEWAGEGAEGCCISLAGCEKLEALGLDTSDLYIGVRKLRNNEMKKPDIAAQHEAGLKLAAWLVG